MSRTVFVSTLNKRPDLVKQLFLLVEGIWWLLSFHQQCRLEAALAHNQRGANIRMHSNDAFHSDRVDLLSSREDNHIVGPALIMPEAWFGGMWRVEIFHGIFLKIWKCVENSLRRFPLWLPHDDHFVQVFPTTAKLRPQTWTKAIVLPLVFVWNISW